MLRGSVVVGMVLGSELAGMFVSIFAFPILAEITPVDLPFKFDINNFTAVSVLAWYAWHNASRVVPKLVTDNQEQVMNMAKMNQSSIESMTSRYVADLSTARNQFEAMLERERKWGQEQTELLRERVHEMAQLAQNQSLEVVKANGEVVKAVGMLYSIHQQYQTNQRNIQS